MILCRWIEMRSRMEEYIRSIALKETDIYVSDKGTYTSA